MEPLNSTLDPQRLSKAALQAFFSICTRWELTDAQKRQLLGNPTEAIYQRWVRDQSDQRLDEDVLIRISHLVGIEKALYRLLAPEQADTWVKRPNTAAMFQGRSALDKMLTGNLNDLSEVRRYLEVECV